MLSTENDTGEWLNAKQSILCPIGIDWKVVRLTVAKDERLFMISKLIARKRVFVLSSVLCNSGITQIPRERFLENENRLSWLTYSDYEILGFAALWEGLMRSESRRLIQFPRATCQSALVEWPMHSQRGNLLFLTAVRFLPKHQRVFLETISLL